VAQDRPAAQSNEPIRKTACKSSEYEDAAWEVLGGQAGGEQEFQPLEVPVLPAAASYVDPLFDDFGGTQPTQAGVRWHLPAELSCKAGRTGRDEPEEPAAPTYTLTEEQLKKIQDEAYEAGRKDAYEDAVTKSHQKLEGAQKRVQEMLLDMRRQIEERLQLIEKQAVELALAVSKKIIDRAVEINPEYIVRLLTDALQLAGTASIKTIRVSPQDLEFIELVGVAKSIKGFDEQWHFAADPSIKAGCVIDTSAGEIDYQLDPAWERVQEQVMKIAR